MRHISMEIFDRKNVDSQHPYGHHDENDRQEEMIRLKTLELQLMQRQNELLEKIVKALHLIASEKD